MKVRELIQDLLLAQADLDVWVGPTDDMHYAPIATDPFELAYVAEDGTTWFEDDEFRPGPINAIVIWPGD